jgi:type IV secretory pathway TraG/TraD family ATPase VirD4
VIAILLNSIDVVLPWAMEDEETTMIMAPIISAWKNKAAGQLAGVETSAQLPISILLDPNIFWVMSADEFNLDITNQEKPFMLCIGNSKKLQQALAPAISVILTVIMKEMNSTGKVPSVFCFDEFPTVKVNGIDTFIATARKHHVSTILALQDFTQAERDYGKNTAHILRASCGNQFFGMTGNLETARFVSEMLGEIKKENVSYTTNKDNISTSESLQREKVLQARDLFGQAIGNFTGKIAGGKPPFFSSQFEEFKFDDIPIPDFACKDTTGDVDMDRQILNNQVKDNYNKILREAKSLLDKYR